LITSPLRRAIETTILLNEVAKLKIIGKFNLFKKIYNIADPKIYELTSEKSYKEFKG